MTSTSNRIVKGAAVAAAALVAGCAACATVRWLRYGRPRRRGRSDLLLDRFMPDYEVAECHQVEVAAPPAVTFAAARETGLDDSALVRAIFRARELLMGAGHGQSLPGGILEQTLALGWGVLAEDAGREIVVGAATQPWRADVQFRALAPRDFASFDEPGYAKIVWTLAASPLGPGRSLFRTETRVVTTDADARRRFRLYWSFLSPGIRLIRREMLRLVKRKAERAYAASPARMVGPARPPSVTI